MTPFQRLDTFEKAIFLVLAGIALLLAAVFFVLFMASMLAGIAGVFAFVGMLIAGRGADAWSPICVGMNGVNSRAIRGYGGEFCNALPQRVPQMVSDAVWTWHPFEAYLLIAVGLFVTAVVVFAFARMFVLVATTLDQTG